MGVEEFRHILGLPKGQRVVWGCVRVAMASRCQPCCEVVVHQSIEPDPPYR